MSEHQAKQEYMQGIARFGVCVIALIFHLVFLFLGYELPPYNIPAITLYGIISFFWLFWVKATPGRFLWRRTITIFFDMAINCLMMATLKDYAAYYYPLFLWMIVGYGMRFGSKHLRRAWMVSLIFFGVTLYLTPYWLDHRHLGLGLFLGLCILPFFYASLIGKLHESNAQLKEELENKAKIFQGALEELNFLKSINQNASFHALAHSILQRATELFPKAENIRFLSPEQDSFCLFRMDQDKIEPFPVDLEPDKVHLEILDTGRKVLENAFIIERVGESMFLEDSREMPHQMLVITFLREERFNGALIFDFPETLEEQIDVRTLDHFSCHSESALNKMWLLQDLEARNRQLMKRQEQLMMQERMASLGNISKSLAREIRIPVDAINSCSRQNGSLITDVYSMINDISLINDEEVNNALENVVANLEDIQQHSSRLSLLARAINNLTLAEAINVDMNTNELLHQCLNLVFDTRLQKLISLSISPDPVLDHYQCSDHSLLGRAVINILKNSREAIEARMEKEPHFKGSVAMHSHLKGFNLFITIQDNGGGIPAYLEGRIFEPFFTTRPPETGHVGLGLAISYDIITSLGGTIEINNRPEQGVTFMLGLPCKTHSTTAGA